MTQTTTAQSVQIQEAKNRVAQHRRTIYRPQASNKHAQVSARIISLEHKPLINRVVSCGNTVRPFHHRSQPMPVAYSTQRYFYADTPTASAMQMAFAGSLQ